MNALMALTEEELFEKYRNALLHRNNNLVQRIVREYGRRELTTINGEPIERVFARNPHIKDLYNEGKNLNK